MSPSRYLLRPSGLFDKHGNEVMVKVCAPAICSPLRHGADHKMVMQLRKQHRKQASIEAKDQKTFQE